MKAQIKEAIKWWWNDSMRKTWRIDLADPVSRTRCLDELADEIAHHLTSNSSRAADACACSKCGCDVEEVLCAYCASL